MTPLELVRCFLPKASKQRFSAARRKQTIFQHIDARGHGIEIGPGHSPVAPKKEGYKVEVIDIATREELIRGLQLRGTNSEAVEEVDFVWRGQSYVDLLKKSEFYDWIIASHVIEHVPDIVDFLNNCSSILKEDGVLSLAVPDKRYCFDHFRPITGLARVIDCHNQKVLTNTPGTVAEYYLSFVQKGGREAWSRGSFGKFRFRFSSEEAQRLMSSALAGHASLDIHAWCFVPSSFRLMIEDLYCLGLTSMREISFSATCGCEFFMTLSRNGQGPRESRLELLNTVERELRETAARGFIRRVFA